MDYGAFVGVLERSKLVHNWQFVAHSVMLRSQSHSEKKGGFALVNEQNAKYNAAVRTFKCAIVNSFVCAGWMWKKEEEFLMLGQSRKMPHSHSRTPVQPFNESYESHESCHVMYE